MALFKPGNPAFNETSFDSLDSAYSDEPVMTVGGTIRKTALLLLTTFATAAWSWWKMSNMSEPLMLRSWILPLILLSFGVALVLVFRKHWAPWLAPIYAAMQGVVMGILSAFFEALFPGIVTQAMLITLCIFAVMLTLYQARVIRVTAKFRSVITIAITGIMFYYLISLVLMYFNVAVPLIHDNGMAGIIFSIVVVVVASLSFLLDFDLIEQGASRGAPQWMEWYAAFGLLVTLIWLYLEILRLLSKLNSRN
jgi:uncharacterized YccA/Bax inhibitor family protein